MKIDLLIPTRARAKRLYTLLDSIRNTVKSTENIVIYFYIDDDDVQTLDAQEQMKKDFSELNIVFNVGPRIVLSCAWNELWRISDSEIIMHAGDDIVFKSQDWDAIVINEFEKVDDRVLMVFGRDGINDEKLATHSFTSREVTKLKGWFVPPYFKALYNDTWLDFIYKKINRAKFVPEIFTDHLHFSKYPELTDSTYTERRQINKDESELLWIEKTPEKFEHAELLQQYIDDYKARSLNEV